MKISFLYILLIILACGCATQEPESLPLGLEIKEIKPNKWTALTKQNIIQLAQVYDLEPFLFTKKIRIQSQVIPQSHPVLTLNTRNAEHPKKLLSSWLHEEFHWWASRNIKNVQAAIIELKKIYPKARAMSNSTYLHLIVCHLEVKALVFYLGKMDARKTINEIMQKDKIYPWIYYQNMHKDYAIKKIVKKYRLYPPELSN